MQHTCVRGEHWDVLYALSVVMMILTNDDLLSAPAVADLDMNLICRKGWFINEHKNLAMINKIFLEITY